MVREDLVKSTTFKLGMRTQPCLERHKGYSRQRNKRHSDLLAGGGVIHRGDYKGAL